MRPEVEQSQNTSGLISARLASAVSWINARFGRFLELPVRVLPKSNWLTAVVVAIVSELVTITLAAPNIWQPICDSRCQDVVTMASGPLSPMHLNWSLSAYRITTPLLAYTLGLKGNAVLCLPFLANIVSFGLLFCLLSRFLPLALAQISVLGFALTQVGQVGNTWLGWPDPLSNVALLTIMLSTNRFVIGAATVLGALNDERFMIGLPLALIWHLVSGRQKPKLKLYVRFCVPAALGILLAAFVRHAITIGYWGDPVPKNVYESFQVFGYSKNLWHRPLAIFFSFRWLWALPALASGLAWRINRGICLAFALITAACCCLLTVPGDMTRSMAVAFPILLIALRYLAIHRLELLKDMMPSAVLLNILTPMLNVYLLDIWPVYPMPIVIVRLFVATHRARIGI